MMYLFLTAATAPVSSSPGSTTPGSTTPESCPPPTSENCFTRILSNPSSSLHARFPVEVSVSSISLRNKVTAVPLVWTLDQLQGAIVIVHGDNTSTKCAMGQEVASSHGFVGFRLECGATGSRISMAFPKNPDERNLDNQVVVRLCTVRADSA